MFILNVLVFVYCLGCVDEKLMTWMPGSTQWMEPGKDHDVSDIDKLLDGKAVSTVGNKMKPKFTVLLKKPHTVEITKLMMKTTPKWSVKEVMVKLKGVPSEVSEMV